MMGYTSIGVELVLIGRFSVEISPSAEILSRRDVLRGRFVDGDWLEVRASQQMQVAKIECCTDQQFEAFLFTRQSEDSGVEVYSEASDIMPTFTGRGRHSSWRAMHQKAIKGTVWLHRVRAMH